MPVFVTIAISSGTGALPGSSFVESIDNAHFPQAFTDGQKTWLVFSNARLGFSERRLTRATMAPSDHLRPPAQITSQSYQKAFPPADSPPNTWYVSRRGNNGDGQSWETAWNELDQINWSVVPAGSTILIDGGAVRCESPVKVTGQSAKPQAIGGGDCGLVYETTLDINRGDVTLSLTTDVGRNGTAIIFGGRSVPLPYCSQSNWPGSEEGLLRQGIEVNENSGVVIDGTHWGGIMVYGMGRNGINLSNGTRNLVIRNVEVFDNGTVRDDGDPDQEGINLQGNGLLFERFLAHDNGQDNFQSGGIVNNFTLRESWLYNLRLHPTEKKSGNPLAFNHCRHPDAIQVYGGGVQSGFLIEDSIIGPGFLQGMLLGGGAKPDQWAVLNDVTIRNVLVFKALNGNVLTHGGAPHGSSNWVLENVTSYRPEAPNDGSLGWWNVWVRGSGHTIRDSVFYGGRHIGFPNGNANVSGNCSFKVGGYDVGPDTDPQFANVNHQDWLSLDDFTVQNPACKGSRITSVEMLIGELPTAPLPADLNQDGHIDVLDVQLGVNVYLGTETQTQVVSQADVNQDGEVNVLDIQIIVNAVLSD